MGSQPPPVAGFRWPLVAALAVVMGATFALTFFSGRGGDAGRSVPAPPPASGEPAASAPGFEGFPAETAGQPVASPPPAGGDAGGDETMDVVPVSAADADGMEIIDVPPAPGDPEIDAILHPVPADPGADPAAQVLPEGEYRMGDSGLEPVKGK